MSTRSKAYIKRSSGSALGYTRDAVDKFLNHINERAAICLKILVSHNQTGCVRYHLPTMNAKMIVTKSAIVKETLLERLTTKVASTQPLLNKRT